jgi:hypothetical protein
VTPDDTLYLPANTTAVVACRVDARFVLSSLALVANGGASSCLVLADAGQLGHAEAPTSDLHVLSGAGEENNDDAFSLFLQKQQPAQR